MGEKMKLEQFPTAYTKINSKWIKDLNVGQHTIKLLEENIGRTLSDIDHSKSIFDPPTRVMTIKAKINKCDLSKIKSFCIAKETIKKKNNLQKGKKKLANEPTDKRFISKYTAHVV